MRLFDLLCGRWSHRQRAMALYQRAMACANKHDRDAALDDYTTVIEMTTAPADIRAMALYNRAVVLSAMHNDAAAIRDLNELLGSRRAPRNVKVEAKRKLMRLERPAHGPENGPVSHA